MARDEAVREQAAAWAVRTGDPGFDDWEGFTAWLERDADHARAYDQVNAAVIEAAEALPVVPPALNDDEPGWWTRRRWLGGAMTLALAGLVGIGVWQLDRGSYTVETAPGEVQLLALGEGDEIALAGGSRIVLDRDNTRFASLERGQALFTVRHDETAPFMVEVGEDRIVDVGTVFDVTRTDDELRVAVSEGEVILNPRRQNARVLPGQSLTKAAGSQAFEIEPVPVSEVGEWREGRITFQDASLAEVSAELTRATGTSFAASPRASEQRVSGSLMLEAVRRDPRALGPLLGVIVRYNGSAWEIGTS
jgi:transmembrane sensor